MKKRLGPPVTLTVDEYKVVKELATLENVPIGALVRRLIAQEALRRGLLPPIDERTSRGQQSQPQGVTL